MNKLVASSCGSDWPLVYRDLAILKGEAWGTGDRPGYFPRSCILLTFLSFFSISYS